MRMTRLVGLGTICVSAGIGVWACGDDSTGSPATAPDGGPITLDSGGKWEKHFDDIITHQAR